jgi:hypothetical protein
MADRFPLIANSSSNQIQELASADNLDLTGNNIVGVVDITASGNVSVGGTLTYEDVTNIDSVGIVTARSGLEVGAAGVGGTISATGNVEFAGLTTAKFAGVTETVSIASTTNIVTAKSVIMELDCSKGSVFTHNLTTGGNVGIVSIKNFKVDANSFTTATVIFTQGSVTPTAGAGNTIVVSPTAQVPAGIGTEVTLAPLGVAANAGIETSARVGSATTVVLSAVANDIDIVTFGIHYNGGGTGTAGNYTTIVTKSGDIRFGTIGF